MMVRTTPLRNQLDSATNELSVPLKSGSRIRARLEKGSLYLDVKGIDFEIAEVAEQLAWLGSALQPSGKSRYSTTFVSLILP